MIRRWRSTVYNRNYAGTGSDTDALQTDVMRFMSILGLCLMAVFALVQSLPLQKEPALQQETDRTQLHDEIAIQQQRAQILKTELQYLISLIEQAKAEKTEVEQQLIKAVDQTEKVRSEQHRLSSEVKQMQQHLESSRDTLASLQQSADNKAQSLRSLQHRLHQETRRLDDIQQKARELKRHQEAEERRLEQEKRGRAAVQRQKKAVNRQRAKVTLAPEVEEQKTKPLKKGFTLRFASDEALQHQVATGSVTLYAMVDKQAWRLSLPHGRPLLSSAEFPGWFHEMAASTVPVNYLRQLEIVVDPKVHHGAVVWGVQLPPATKHDITSLIRGRQGGDLVIASNGRVSLATE
ncbi:MAG: hypothetical protein GY792_29835 [Gammaproteobacteria bacterium]|nr:hypothetical protein [Gammaproteobacteria bacterium]MCP5090366.1 hypothetical protein [Gammaproteobacteria bacterium]